MEKIVATIVVPGGPLSVVYLIGIASGNGGCITQATADSAGNSNVTTITCAGTATWPGGVGPMIAIAWLVLPFVVAFILLSRISQRAAGEPSIPVFAASPLSGSRWGGLEIAAVLLLSVGGFVIPVGAPAAGLVCAWISTAWTTRGKWIATIIFTLALVYLAVKLNGRR